MTTKREQQTPEFRMEEAVRSAWIAAYVRDNPEHESEVWHMMSALMREKGGGAWRALAVELIRQGCMPPAPKEGNAR